MENNWKNKNFLLALRNAFNGIKYVIKTERNIKIQLVFAIIAILFSAFFKISLIEWGIIFLVIFLVIFAELFNTAVEKVVNMITMEYDENAKIAKDIAAGCVTIMSLASVVIGCIIFIPKIINFIEG